jgi:hypothetical protein
MTSFLRRVEEDLCLGAEVPVCSDAVLCFVSTLMISAGSSAAAFETEAWAVARKQF